MPTPRTPVEFTDFQHKRVGNQVSVADGQVLSISDPSLEIPEEFLMECS